MRCGLSLKFFDHLRTSVGTPSFTKHFDVLIISGIWWHPEFWQRVAPLETYHGWTAADSVCSSLLQSLEAETRRRRVANDALMSRRHTQTTCGNFITRHMRTDEPRVVTWLEERTWQSTNQRAITPRRRARPNTHHRAVADDSRCENVKSIWNDVFNNCIDLLKIVSKRTLMIRLVTSPASADSESGFESQDSNPVIIKFDNQPALIRVCPRQNYCCQVGLSSIDSTLCCLYCLISTNIGI